MQSPRSLEISSSERPQALAEGAEIRARMKAASERLLPRIRWHLATAGLSQAGDLNDQARDILQDVVLEALRSEHKYDPSRDLFFWLHGIAMNVVRRRVERFRKVRGRLPPEAPAAADDAAVEALHEDLVHAIPAHGSAGPDEALAFQQEVEAVLSPLSEQHRQVLRLYYLEHDQDNEAVAAALGISPGAERVRRCRALQAARKGSSR
jgi:RNA polymerase sigma factor (sigma-70 family)